jgi:pyruvate dehydrogenase E2 component (dihydrolipoamide acetyltransferase)
MTDILMPALSPTMEEGSLAKWLVKVGDKVRSGDVIAEIETDKATMEVEAVDEGVIDEIVVAAGTEGVKVGALIAVLLAEGEERGAAKPAPAAAPAAPKAEAAPAPAAAPAAKAASGDQGLAPSVRRIAAEEGLDVASVAGTGRGGRVTKGDALAALSGGGSVARSSGDRVVASPYARKLAGQKGFTLGDIPGTGPNGRIIARDVEGFTPSAKPAAAPAAEAKAAPAATAPAAGKLPALEALGIPPGSYDVVPLDGMRKAIARRLTDSFRDIPHFPLSVDIELTNLLAGRVAINQLLEKEGVKVSVNDLLIKACGVALKRVPEANASFTPDGIAMHHHADVAVAVAIEGGLITPIIKEVENKGLAQISKEMKDLAKRARERKLKPEEFQGGTFSLSNLGMFGVKTFSSIINPPQGCILSVGAGEKRPWVRDGQLVVADVMTVTLTCDHRVVDGSVGAQWISTFKSLVENPIGLLV